MIFTTTVPQKINDIHRINSLSHTSERYVVSVHNKHTLFQPQHPDSTFHCIPPHPLSPTDKDIVGTMALSPILPPISEDPTSLHAHVVLDSHNLIFLSAFIIHFSRGEVLIDPHNGISRSNFVLISWRHKCDPDDRPCLFGVVPFRWLGGNMLI